MNYFVSQRSANLYREGRPDFHEISILRMKEYLNMRTPFAKALDIACGTGLSTKALLNIATEVYGTDSSQAMIDNAPLQDIIHYSCANAGKQPFENNTFNLITVCSGIHWFDIDSFLQEANRLLKPDSWLVLYDNYFMAEMENNPLFKEWHQQVYLKQYPAPPRNSSYDWSKTNLLPKHFEPTHEDIFTNTVAFSQNDLINYFMSQSNTIAAVENNLTTDETIRARLNAELSSFFSHPDQQQFFRFGNWMLYLRNTKHI